MTDTMTEEEKKRLSMIEAKAKELRETFSSLYALPRQEFDRILRKTMRITRKWETEDAGRACLIQGSLIRRVLRADEISLCHNSARYEFCINTTISADIIDLKFSALAIKRVFGSGDVVMIVGDCGPYVIPKSEAARVRKGHRSLRIANNNLVLAVAKMLNIDMEATDKVILKIEFVKDGKDGRMKMYKIRRDDE